MDESAAGPQAPTPEQQLEQLKLTIKCVEGFFTAINAGSYPYAYASQISAGMSFLQQLHTNMVGQLPKDELDKLKAEFAKNAPAPQPEPAKAVDLGVA